MEVAMWGVIAAKLDRNNVKPDCTPAARTQAEDGDI